MMRFLKKQLELREREIALKEKEMELKMLQRDDDNSIGKEKMLMAREGFRYTKKVNSFSFAFIASILMGTSEKSEPILESIIDKKMESIKKQ